jgi:hypothetical protein
LFSIFCASLAEAQVQRTFVSGLGSDSNSCSRTAPCRTFTQAISQTNPGGEVYVLDSAGYGPFTVDKTVAIVAPPGVTAGISVFSGDGIDINAGASDTIILRGLTINNQGSSGVGILFISGGTLHVENCVVNGFSGVGLNGCGLFFNAGAYLEVKDSIFRGNSLGIEIAAPYPATALAMIDQVRIERGGAGLDVTAGGNVTVRNSVVSGNHDQAFGARGGTLSATLNIENCVASHDGIGASAINALATVRLSNSTLTNNSGWGLVSINGGVILSRGNNTVEGNGADTSGPIGSYNSK